MLKSSTWCLSIFNGCHWMYTKDEIPIYRVTPAGFYHLSTTLYIGKVATVLQLKYGHSIICTQEIHLRHSRNWELTCHDDVMKWEHLPRYWPFVWGIHRSPVNSPHKGQWREALMFSLICAWTNSWAINGDTGDLRRHHAHNDVIVMCSAHIAEVCHFHDTVDR